MTENRTRRGCGKLSICRSRSKNKQVFQKRTGGVERNTANSYSRNVVPAENMASSGLADDLCPREMIDFGDSARVAESTANNLGWLARSAIAGSPPERDLQRGRVRSRSESRTTRAVPPLAGILEVAAVERRDVAVEMVDLRLDLGKARAHLSAIGVGAGLDLFKARVHHALDLVEAGAHLLA